jgi:OOP family OmpA-OmpF porin
MSSVGNKNGTMFCTPEGESFMWTIKATTLSAYLVTLLAASAVLAGDKPGSADYPEIGRFEGSEITKYSVANFDESTIATGPVKKKSDAANALKLEGKVTRIVYKVPKGSSPIEVFRNFENRVKEAGYQIIFSGGPEEIDDYKFKRNHPVEKLDSVSLSFKIWYLSAKKMGTSSETYLSVLVSPHSGGDGQRARLIAVETKAMENRMVDAAKMKTSIVTSGKIALYGLYFDTDSAKLQATSKPTLDEIGKLLRSEASLKIIVVGHTDNQGGYDHNMDLSRRRAAAVVESLTRDYKIGAARVKSAGVGYLAPAASNAAEDGRALNRRVVLVQDK